MRYRRARQTAWRTIADEMVLLDLERKRMVGLNPTAAFVWQTLDEMADSEAMLRALAAGGRPAFGIRELDAFLEKLVALGLAQRGEPEKREPAAFEPPEDLEPPRILWQETVEQIAATCAFMPGQSELCNQVPFA